MAIFGRTILAFNWLGIPLLLNLLEDIIRMGCSNTAWGLPQLFGAKFFLTVNFQRYRAVPGSILRARFRSGWNRMSFQIRRLRTTSSTFLLRRPEWVPQQ